MSKFKVGDKVQFNNIGLEGIHGLTSTQMIKDSLDLVITRVFDVNNMIPEFNTSNNPSVWLVEVNKESINYLSLMEDYFDKKVN